MKEFFQVFLLIVGFVAVLFGAYFVTRFVASRASYSRGSRYITIRDKVLVGNDRSICLVQVGKRFFLTGITSHHIECIGEIDESDLQPLPIDKGNSFNNMFQSYMEKNKQEKD